MELNLSFYNDILVKEDKQDYKQQKRRAIQLDRIMKKLFMLHDKRPIIDFFNAIYGDNISYDAQISYKNKEAVSNFSIDTARLMAYNCDMFIEVIDGERNFEYIIEFQTKSDRDIAVRLFRYSFELKVQGLALSNGNIVIDMPEPYIIVLEENKNVPQCYNMLLRFKDGRNFSYHCRVLKYWEYDLKALYENNMYLLFPLKVFETRKKIQKYNLAKENANNKGELKSQIRDDILELIEEIYKNIDNVYLENKITIEDYNEFNIIIANLFEYLNYELDKTGDMVKEVQDMVKTFYDKRVEERGIEKGIIKGIEKGIEKGKRETTEEFERQNRNFIKNLLLNGVSKEVIMASGKFTEAEIDRIVKEIQN